MVKEKEEKYGVGKRFITGEGYEIEIVEKLEKDKRKVRLESGHEIDVCIANIYSGTIKNPYHPSVYGVGYIGLGDYRTSINKKHTPEYLSWYSMLCRCYDDKLQEKYPTYKGVTICEEWLNFQNFAKWYTENLPKVEGVKFQLDKDLLQHRVENKIYSPSTCVFLPHNVNSFLTNKKSDNTSGCTGVSWDKARKKWTSQINLFGENKIKNIGFFPTPRLASEAYQQARLEQAEVAKDYLRSLNYLPEHIIQLIK